LTSQIDHFEAGEKYRLGSDSLLVYKAKKITPANILEKKNGIGRKAKLFYFIFT
jgi:hypothetical protein